MARCQAKTKSGRRCKAAAMKGSKYCMFHQPKKKSSFRKRPSKGRKRRSTSKRYTYRK